MIAAILVAAALFAWPAGGLASGRLLLAVAAGATVSRGDAAAPEPGTKGQGSARGHVDPSTSDTLRGTPLAGRALRAVAAEFPALGVRLRALARRRGPQPVTADDAWAVDLLAAAYAAGLGPVAALRAVSSVVPGGAAQAFGTAAAKAAMGQGIAEALAQVESLSGVIPRVREALGRSESAGGSVAESLLRAAVHARSRAATRRKAAAERAGVLIAGPLGACFLPAFVCLGVAPVVLGLAGRILPEVFP